MKKSERKSRSINYDIKSDIKTPKEKKNLIGLPTKELKIPTLNEIHSALAQILISKQSNYENSDI